MDRIGERRRFVERWALQDHSTSAPTPAYQCSRPPRRRSPGRSLDRAGARHGWLLDVARQAVLSARRGGHDHTRYIEHVRGEDAPLMSVSRIAPWNETSPAAHV